MPFTTTMTGVGDITGEVTEELITQFELAFAQENVVDAFVERKHEINAKSISFPIFDQLALITSALTEDADAASVAMGDSLVTLTPLEYGNVVTNTALANLHTGGQAGMAAMRLIGSNMAQSMNKIATLKLETSTNIKYVNDRANKAAIVAGDIMDATTLNAVYNKLARANVPVHPVVGTYVAFMHDDIIHDIRAGSAAGSWTDVNKYANELPVLTNEVGMYKGFRVVRNNHCLIDADAGTGNVDVYTSSFIGGNALGLAESVMPQIRVTGPFDKLGRFVNVGWYAVRAYGLIQTSASWVVNSSSSVGDNA